MRFRVLRRRITQAEFEKLSRNQRYDLSDGNKTVVYIPQRKLGIFGWVAMDADEPLKVYYTQDQAEREIFLAKAGMEIVVAEFISKDDPLYRVKIPNES